MLESYREGSVLASAARRCRARVTSVSNGSRLLERAGSLYSSLRRRATGIGSRLQHTFEHSTISKRTAGTRTRIATAAAEASVRSLGTTLQRYVTSSFGYQWLTAEPNPDVIVIDLRETVVGTLVIRPLEWTIETITDASSDSRLVEPLHYVHHEFRSNPIRLLGFAGLASIPPLFGVLALTGNLSVVTTAGVVVLAAAAGLATRARWSLDELLETRVAKALAATFEPPAPPERASTDGNDESTSEDDTDRES
ncbi:hypothetical protein [Natronosalvus vescus]|uniref:hypothetical protein n=1 Tax=Natronosalvus vescus TaxID=2953881 RepID=UPI00209021DA|nr:hypothetical protein [Natronosalvus vescus]